ncbi:DgyrCDS9111 [Dimorphilus gyrociliatus]|nr:DgyrCDS9111 [Dimorphilus gyrociliatus]
MNELLAKWYGYDAADKQENEGRTRKNSDDDRVRRTKSCDWCHRAKSAHCKVDLCDGQLQFCSESCLNQYKMNIFCRETEEHLNSAKEDKAEPQKDDRIIITPELWNRTASNAKGSSRKREASSERNSKVLAEKRARLTDREYIRRLKMRDQDMHTPLPTIKPKEGQKQEIRTLPVLPAPPPLPLPLPPPPPIIPASTLLVPMPFLFPIPVPIPIPIPSEAFKNLIEKHTERRKSVSTTSEGSEKIRCACCEPEEEVRETPEGVIDLSKRSNTNSVSDQDHRVYSARRAMILDAPQERRNDLDGSSSNKGTPIK